MNHWKVSSVMLLIVSFFILACNKDEALTYPVVANYRSTLLTDDFKVWVKENDTLIEVSRELTRLDEDPRFDEISSRPAFKFFEFIDETSGRYLFDPSFNILADTADFQYRQEGNQLIFENFSVSTRDIPFNGTASSFEIPSQATLFRGSTNGFFPNYFIIEPMTYANLMENGDTLVDLRYSELYEE